MLRIVGRKRLWLTVGVGLLAFGLLAWPRAAAGGISRGLSVCGGVVLPALFPFLVLGGFVVRSGIAAALGRRVSGLTRPLFGLPGCAAPALLVAFIGGYPAGANAVAALYREGQLSREEGRRLLRFCVCGGPGFLVNAVGVGLTGYSEYGWVLFGAGVLSALLIGVTVPREARRKREEPAAFSEKSALSPAAALVESVTAACGTVLVLCGFVLLFSAVLALCEAGGITGWLGRWGVLLPCLLEVSSGCTAAAHAGAAAPVLLGFASGFGGVSVGCQVAAAVSGTDLMSRSFWLYRLWHGVLCAGITRLLYAVVPLPLPVFGSGSVPVASAAAVSLPVSAALLVLCGVWMLSVGQLGQRTA